MCTLKRLLTSDNVSNVIMISKTQCNKAIKIVHNIYSLFCRFVPSAASNNVISVMVEFSLFISINIRN